METANGVTAARDSQSAAHEDQRPSSASKCVESVEGWRLIETSYRGQGGATSTKKLGGVSSVNIRTGEVGANFVKSLETTSQNPV